MRPCSGFVNASGNVKDQVNYNSPTRQVFGMVGFLKWTESRGLKSGRPTVASLLKGFLITLVKLENYYYLLRPICFWCRFWC